MITTQTRIKVINDVNEAVDAGSKRSSACELVGLAESTLRRWKPKGEDSIRSDQSYARIWCMRHFLQAASV